MAKEKRSKNKKEMKKDRSSMPATQKYIPIQEIRDDCVILRDGTVRGVVMASSGNFVNDIIERYFIKNISAKASIRLSMIATLIIGAFAVIIAAQFNTVLNAILYAYAFMVSGLFVPTLRAYFWKKASSAGALAGMLSGGILTLLLLTNFLTLPDCIAKLQLDASVYGILSSAVTFICVSILWPDKVGVNRSLISTEEEITC